MFPRETPPPRKLSDSTFDMASVLMMAENRMIFIVAGDEVWMCGNERERLMIGQIMPSWEMGRSDG